MNRGRCWAAVFVYTRADNLAYWVGSLVVVGLGEYKLSWADASASACWPASDLGSRTETKQSLLFLFGLYLL
jgi:hypothetical protein